MVDGHGFLWTLFPLLFKTQRAVDPTNPWLDPTNPKLNECSSDEEDLTRDNVTMMGSRAPTIPPAEVDGDIDIEYV